MPDVIRLSLLPKGHAGMPSPTSSNYLCSPKGMMEFHVDVVRCVLSKVRLWHVKPDVLRPSVVPKVDDRISTPNFIQLCV